MVHDLTSNVVNFSNLSRLSFSKVSNVIDSFLEFYFRKELKSKKFAKGYLILCPFHDDTDPSLALYRDGTTWCFSCGKAYKLEAVLRSYGFWEGEIEEEIELKPNLSKLEEERWRVCDHRQYLYTDGERTFIRVRVEFEDIQTKARKKAFYFFQPTIKDGEQVLELVRGWVPLILYRLPEIEDKEWVFFVEGEKCADALWGLGLQATTLPIGAKTKINRELIEALLPLRGKTVYILPDSDNDGWQYAKTINQALNALGVKSQIISVPRLWDKSDVADFIEVEVLKGKSKEEIKDEILGWCKGRERVVSFWQAMTMEREKGFDRFIVPGLFPAKGLGLLVGRSKMGKTELLCLVVAKLLKGENLFGRPSERVKVLWITQEDTKGSIGLRLLMRGITPQELQESLFTVEVGEETVISKEILIEEAQRLGCQVVIVEPLLAIKELAELGLKDKLTYGAVYGVLLPLKKQAEKAGIFILGVHHANKGRAIIKDWTDVIDGALGSTAFSGVPDCIIGIGLTSSGDQALRRVIAKGRGVSLDYLVEWVFEGVKTRAGERRFGKYLEKGEFAPEFDLTLEQRRLVDAIRELEQRGEEATPKRLAQELDKKEGAVKMMLQDLMDKGVVSRTKRGCYLVSIKKQKTDFPDFSDLTYFSDFSDFSDLADLADLALESKDKSQEKSDRDPDFRSLENSGLEGKVRKVSQVSHTFATPTPTPNQTPDPTSEPTPVQTPDLPFDAKPKGTPDRTSEPSEEEVLYILMPEENKCPICQCEVWKVAGVVYAMRRGVGVCARCGHISWFGNFSKGKVLESKADVEYFLADLSF
jgi:replicative DNA helicase